MNNDKNKEKKMVKKSNINLELLSILVGYNDSF